MSKLILACLLAFLITYTAGAQMHFNLTVKLDNSINPRLINYQYYDGKNTIVLPDSFKNKSVIVIKRKYYSQLASLIITYFDSTKNNYGNEFFVGDKPATIALHFRPNSEHKLDYTLLKHATEIYDSVTNKLWKSRIDFMRRHANQQENDALVKLLTDHPDFYKSDSLKRIFNTINKHFQELEMAWIKTHPGDYFSFWHFNNSVAQVAGLLSTDKPFLQEQLTFFKTTFPPKFTNSIEGKRMIQLFEEKINGIPIKLNDPAPTFSFTAVDVGEINLNQFKGKYVLLDFWATWCAPCMAEMPFIKQIRQKYPIEKLAIIGISADADSKKLIAVTKQQQMDWPQYYDLDKRMRELYQVPAIPVLYLIDPNGKIVYKSDMEHADADALPKVLDMIN